MSCKWSEVEFINTVKYEESVWMKIRSERGREVLYIGCVYMPTDSTSVSVMDSCYERLKEDVLSFRDNGKVVLLDDFNARVGTSAQLDDVVGMFGENTCNASRNRLLSFLNELELMICNGRKHVFESDWTRIRPSFLHHLFHVNIFILNSTLLPKCLYISISTFVFSPSSNFLLFRSLIHSSTQAINEADQLSPCLITSSHSLLSISKELQRSSTILLYTFLCLPLHGLIFHS